MRIRNRGAFFGRLALATVLSAGAAACDSSTEPDHDHDEAVGLVVLDHATEETLVTVNSSRQVTGSLSVQAGQERSIEVWFVGEDGDRFVPEGDHSLGIAIADPSRASIHMHGDHGHFEGLLAGSTTVVFSIVHGSHSDYDSPAIPITVTP
ncbi:MAG TPA: hypothetical protein VHG51_08990 [Longimicrobiaceae bacterium]|nr:hypothetical protein [Longimicrobiaceae bacterium]